MGAYFVGVSTTEFFYLRNFKGLFPVLSKQIVKYQKRETHPPSKAINQFFGDSILNDNLAMFNVTAEGAGEAPFLPATSVWVN